VIWLCFRDTYATAPSKTTFAVIPKRSVSFVAVFVRYIKPATAEYFSGDIEKAIGHLDKNNTEIDERTSKADRFQNRHGRRALKY
jgi:hypothetical protein